MRFLLVASASLLLSMGMLAAACSGAASPIDPDVSGDGGAPTETGAGSDGGAGDGAANVDLEQALAARGMTTAKGSFDIIDMTACCATSCSGNNPTSPYGAFFLPPLAGQSAPNPQARGDGMASSYRLRADEAIVYVGTTAPEAAYFGFTPYLMDRDDGTGTRKPIFASLSETLNPLVIGVDAPAGTPVFEKRTAIIVAADETTTNAARDAVIASGVPASAINVLVLDPAQSRFGIDAAADTFGVLFRLALVKDAAKKDAFLKSPPGVVLRVTPKTAAAPKPLPSPVARPKNLTVDEQPLADSVRKLGEAIAAAYPAYDATPTVVDNGEPNPEKCIQNLRFCAGDNRDTLYPSIVARALFETDDDFYVVYGVDHRATGKVTYANASVYAVEHLVGIASVTSDDWKGSASKYLPTDADASKLYAWKIARSCAGDKACLAIPKGGCPTGIENGALGTITFRTYLEPTTKTAPDPSMLVRDRVLRFKKK